MRPQVIATRAFLILSATIAFAACSGSEEASEEVEEDASTVDTASDDAIGGDTSPPEDVVEDVPEQDVPVPDTTPDTENDSSPDVAPEVVEDVVEDVEPDVPVTVAIIEAVSPLCGTNAGGVSMRLDGSQLAGVETVSIGELGVAPDSVRANSLDFTLPPAPGVVGFVAAGVSGTNLSAEPLDNAFYYHDAYAYAFDEAPIGDTFRRFIALGDLDGDGRADRVLADDTGVIVERLADDSGNWTDATTLEDCTTPSAMDVGDVDGDGRNDLVVGCGGNIEFFVGEDGTVPDPAGSIVASATTSPFHLELILRDVDGDADLDIVERWQGSDSVVIFLNDGLLTFQSPAFVSMGASMTAVEVADVAGDDSPDLITGHFAEGVIRVRLGNGDGTFGEIVETALPGIQTIVAGEFSGDDKSDVVIGSNDAGVGGSSYTFADTGEAVRFLQYVGGGLSGASVADLDGDGMDDAVVSTTPGVRFYLSSVPAPVECSVPVEMETGPRWMYIDDINGDGLPDLLSFNGGANRIVRAISTLD